MWVLKSQISKETHHRGPETIQAASWINVDDAMSIPYKFHDVSKVEVMSFL